MKNVGYSFGFPEQATATVEVRGRFEGERRARVRVGAADVGQGAHLALRQIAAEALALPLERVEMVTDDSAEAPNAGSASASRLTLMAGRAVAEAAARALAEWRETEQEHVVATYQFRPPRTTPPCTTWGGRSTGSRWRGRSRGVWRRRSATRCSRISR
jgi:CO/xanthine dehydrogenase Mo-binding subunit